jgi:AmmeMemoRadiSam system protein A/AmmeMemoRadiSam system protein B
MLKAYLVPHPPLLVAGIGRGDEVPDTRNAFRTIAAEIEKNNPDTLIFISPHSILYDDYIHIAPGKSASGDFGNFGASEIKFNVEYDDELASEIAAIAAELGLSAGLDGAKHPELDHGVMVPLSFLGTERKIVRISISGLSALEHYRFGTAIIKAATRLNRSIAVIASGDMSHKLKHDAPYGFAQEGVEFDELMRDCVKKPDFKKLLSVSNELRRNAAECGYMSMVMLAGCFEGMNVKSRMLCYEAPFGVGYLTAEFESESIYLRLARASIEAYVTNNEIISHELLDNLPADIITKKAGVFVSLKIDGNLRGCIGTIAPVQESIAQEIIINAISAATSDPRFPAVRVSELDSLEYSVDVLGSPEAIKGTDELDVIKYGVIITCGHKRGLLLPNLDGVDTVEMQVSIAMQKAGIHKDEPYALERFEVIRYR